MSELLMPPNAGAPPAGPPPPDPGANPLSAAMGAGPGGADTAQLPPELMAALAGGGPPEAETGPGEGGMEPASLEAALEHFRLGVQMLQELQVSSSDDRQQHELGSLMNPITKVLADRAKGQAAGPALGGGNGGA